MSDTFPPHSSRSPCRFTAAHDAEQNADKHSADRNDCAKWLDRLHHRQRRHQDRWNSSDFRCHDSNFKLRGTWRWQHWSYDHHQRQSRCRCPRSILDQHEVSPRTLTKIYDAHPTDMEKNEMFTHKTNTRWIIFVVINIINGAQVFNHFSRSISLSLLVHTRYFA